MRAMTTLEWLAVKGKRMELVLALELFDERGRIITDFSWESIGSLGFTRTEAKRLERIQKSLEVLKKLEPVMQICGESWKLRSAELRKARLETRYENFENLQQGYADGLLDLHFEATRARQGDSSAVVSA